MANVFIFNITPTEGNGWSAIHYAAYGGKDSEIDLILGNLSKNGKSFEVNQPTNNGYTPLHLAAQEGHGSTVGKLLEYGANANARTFQGDFSPLMVACQFGKLNTVRALLLHPSTNAYAVCDSGNNSLYIAAQEGHTLIVERLICGPYKGRINECTNASALHIASYQAHYETVELLIKHGADPNAKTKRSQKTPLIMVVTNKTTTIEQKKSVVRLLLQAGANPYAASICENGVSKSAIVQSSYPLNEMMINESKPSPLAWYYKTNSNDNNNNNNSNPYIDSVPLQCLKQQQQPHAYTIQVVPQTPKSTSPSPYVNVKNPQSPI